MSVAARYQISRVITPAASFDLVTLDQAKTMLGIDASDTSQDAAIQQNITAVSAAINRYCDRVFVQQVYRDQYRYVCNWLAAGEPLRTRQFPIATDATGLPLATVTSDGAVLDAAMWEADTESGTFYAIDGAIVDAWTGTTILIDYTGGFDPVPADVQAAALEWVAARYYSVGREPGLRSETIPDLIEQSWDSAGSAASASATMIPPGVEGLLHTYRIISL